MDRQRTEQWLRTHTPGERTFQRALHEFFQGQARRVGNALADFQEITPAVVPLVFQTEAEAERLRPIVHRNMVGLMATGATDELAAVEGVRTSDKTAGDELLTVLPERTRARIRQALEELERQDYWRAIQAETEKRLAEIIRLGIEEQVSNYQIGIRIREQLGGFPANKRAQKIARTEVTGALNAGHEAAREDLYAEGLVVGKRWLTIGDQDVRVDHVTLDQTTAGPREDFNVGGTEAPYPGWWGLPARQRIHCRCTTVSVLAN